ncbi:hypothetical protein [Fodinicola acaciae]|uniref:hypothetical protein n=1 Tax=Fodinicola acaciae TaxID=2681555 RepID=UPI0013D45FBF|nr:hypothetical protein [Fodinicola acaciae]
MRNAIRGAVVALLLLSAAACGTPKPVAKPTHSPSPSATPSATPSASPSQAPTVAADGTNVRACYDGNCEIRVSGSLRIPLQPRFHVRRLSVSASGDQVVVTSELDGDGGGGSQCSIGGGGECSFSFNGPTITVQAWPVSGGGSILRITS